VVVSKEGYFNLIDGRRGITVRMWFIGKAFWGSVIILLNDMWVGWNGLVLDQLVAFLGQSSLYM
jgi:hypothetical protein